MLTSRGWWFLVLVLTIASIGGVMATRGSGTLLIIAIALLLWLGCEWALFSWRAHIVARRFTIHRTIRDQRGPVAALWTNQPFHVDVRLELPRGQLPMVFCEDRWPVAADIVEGQRHFSGPMGPMQSATWSYQAKADRIGMVRWEGVRIRLADLQGFFFHEFFLRDPMERPVLPVMTDTDGRRGDKRLNLLPPPGVHRHRRPGTGSELLDLRDYRPGDPPRRIAWKISARRDQLITREYESEVPLRCTLVIDASSFTRLGPPHGSALTKLCEIAASVAQTAISNRDLVGLAVCDEDQLTYLRPARTSTQLISILQTLARTAPRGPIVATNDWSALLPRAHAVASDLYPELMAGNVNRFPFWLPWLFPPAVKDRSPRRWLAQQVSRWVHVLDTAYRRSYAWRKKVASVLAAKYELGPAAPALLLEDDALLAEWLQHFLAEHRVPTNSTWPIHNDRRCLERQARALTHAVSRGRDNELFVLLGDYVVQADHLEGLLKAARLARARHHQLLVVQPGTMPVVNALPSGEVKLRHLIRHAEQSRRERGWQIVRRSFGRLGALVLPAGSGDPVRLILYRLEQLRAVQGARP